MVVDQRWSSRLSVSVNSSRVERLGEKFAVARAHGAQQQVRIVGGRKSQDRDVVVEALAQEFRGLQRPLWISVEVNHRDTGLGVDRPLRKGGELGCRKVILVIHRNQRPGHARSTPGGSGPPSPGRHARSATLPVDASGLCMFFIIAFLLPRSGVGSQVSACRSSCRIAPGRARAPGASAGWATSYR